MFFAAVDGLGWCGDGPDVVGNGWEGLRVTWGGIFLMLIRGSLRARFLKGAPVTISLVFFVGFSAEGVKLNTLERFLTGVVNPDAKSDLTNRSSRLRSIGSYREIL